MWLLSTLKAGFPGLSLCGQRDSSPHPTLALSITQPLFLALSCLPQLCLDVLHMTQLPPGLLHTLKITEYLHIATEHCPPLLCILISEITGKKTYEFGDWKESQPLGEDMSELWELSQSPHGNYVDAL